MISVITYINEGIMRKLAQMDRDLSVISEAAKQSQVSVTAEFFQKEIDKLEANRSNYSSGLLRVFRSLQSVITTEQKIKSLEATSTLARQVAHDIRSPLSALDIVLATTQNMPEDKRHLARAAITRIKDIANDLLSQAPKPEASAAPAKTSAHLISSLIESILSEKRLQYRNLINAHIDFELTQNAYGLFANVDPVEFKRIISNLINNSVEALPDDKGRVIVLLTSNENQITCEIRDNGRGIPARLRSHLGKKGFSFGKEGTSAGSGLGLYHARTTIESWGGKLDIQSTEDKGTSLFLSLKRMTAPKWFCQSLTIPKGARVVVLDDDSSIHRVWQSRLEQPLFLKEIEILHFSMPEAFQNWLKQKSGPQDIYLIDEEFVGSSRNGLDIIAQHKIAERSILVTNRHEETALLKQVEQAGLRILPKIMAPMIPIDLPDTQTGGATKDKPADEATPSAAGHQNSV
jgi:signal transduction histidine kinase